MNIMRVCANRNGENWLKSRERGRLQVGVTGYGGDDEEAVRRSEAGIWPAGARVGI